MSRIVDPFPSRRAFLAGASAGGVLLTVPGFLSGCASSSPAEKSSAGQVLADAGKPVPANPFQDWFAVDKADVRRAMSELTQHGADQADIYFQYARTNGLRYEDGIVSSATTDITQGVGFRVVIGENVGYAFTEQLTPESMLRTARSAASIALGHKGRPVAAPEEFRVSAGGPSYYQLAIPWSEVGAPQKLPLVEKLAKYAKEADEAVEKVSVSWTDSEERILIATLDGRLIVDERPMTRMSLSVTASKNGKTQSNRSSISARDSIEEYSDERLKGHARKVVDQTLVLFDARRPPAGEMPVVLAAGASGILLHEAIGHGMEADFNRKNTSIYSDMVGREVAEKFVTIVDDGTLPGTRGALNVDDEGTPCQRTTLVDKGRLVSYMHDQISAKHYGIASTGSGRRESYKHAPLPRMRATFMEDGPHTRDEIIASIDRGIIAETFTNGQVQIGAGDYTFYIKNGWLVEKGRVTAPIKDTNIIGNGPETLRRVTMAANDSKLDTDSWTCGKDGQSVPVSQGLPTILVSKMNVGGDGA